MSKTYAVIMAGGSGTRFWPASRASRPKQLLSLAGGAESLLAATVRRLDRFCAASDVIVVTGAAIAGAVEKALPALDRKQILCEPIGRNTAPCVAWATWHVLERDPDANLMVLPSDHHIEDEARFLETISLALGSVQGGALATIGIVPTRPETGYGYIETGSETEPKSGVFRAARFVEKPDHERAVGYVKSGKFLWNAGMFFFNAKAMASQIRKHLPELAKGLDRIFSAADREAAIQSLFPELPSISIDHGVMEKADEILVVPGDFGWNDVGSWQSAWELAAKDERGNALEGPAIVVDGDRNLVRASNGKLIAMVGVSDLVVVETEDAVLVLPRERAQDVREIIERLKKDAALSKLL